MSNDTPLKTSRSLELLGQLHQAIAECAAKEDLLVRDFRSRRYAITQKHDAVVEKLENALNEKVSEADAFFTRKEAVLRASYDKRRRNVQDAVKYGSRNLPRRAQEARERWLGRLQMQRFHSERDIGIKLEAVKSTSAVTLMRLRESRDEILQTQRQARKAVAGYSSFLALMGRRPEPPAPVAASTAQQQQWQMEIRQHLSTAIEQLAAVQKSAIVRLFSVVPPVIAILVALLLSLVAAWVAGSVTVGLIIAGVLLVLVLGTHQLGKFQTQSAVRLLTTSLIDAIRLYDLASASVESKRDAETASIKAEHEKILADVTEKWDRADQVEADFKRTAIEKLKTQGPRVAA
ncbi:MAG: ATP-binding protein, partial [Verrucomicrobiaceae bacterium]|nr:ATP-binding protein [Verrucomicrobiaceae bacterium]